MKLKSKIVKLNNISLIAIMYCICIVSATFARWMNYINVITIAVLVMHIFKTGRIGKSVLCIIWSIFIAVYPLGDAAIRGEAGLSLFTALSYITPMLFLLVGDFAFKNYIKIFIVFLKYFAWFQVLGVILQKVWEQGHIIIAWRLLGHWSAGVTGFTTDATVAAYIICFGVGIYFIEYRLNKEKNNITAWKKLFCSVIMLLAMVITGKRSFLVASVVALMLVFSVEAFNYFHRFIKTSLICVFTVVLAFLVCIGAYYSGMNNALSRLGGTIIGINNGEDVTSMRSTWAVYMNEWRQGRELFGIGWESFVNRISYTRYGGKVPNGHNVYLQILCEEGYVGLMVFVLLLLFTIIVSINNVLYFSRKKEVELLYVSMFSMFIVVIFGVYSYSGNAIYDAIIYLYFFAAIQMVALMRRTRKRIQAERDSREIC